MHTNGSVLTGRPKLKSLKSKSSSFWRSSVIGTQSILKSSTGTEK
jgi:hypothetical protein